MTDLHKNILKCSHLFSLLTDYEAEIIFEYFTQVSINEETVIFLEGDAGEDLYIVIAGEIVSTVQLPDGHRRVLAKFTEGEFFGEMAIFEQAPRSATCTSFCKSELLKLRKNDFYDIIHKYPDIAIKMMYRMLNITTERLEEKNQFLSEMVTWGEEARKRAITDELTGSYNRRYFDDALHLAITRAKATSAQFSLVMIDMDFFRKINEVYSHDEVDKILKEVTSICLKNLKQKDIFARYGGDEFVLILPETTMDQAKSVSDRLCSAVGNMDLAEISTKVSTSVTISLGIATYPESGLDAETLIRESDRALYEAKNSGRNRAVCA
ncbi:MAG: hypothetical protein CVV44_23185 [Spirochaetae bacterium HGW-Spirochaetae-1]|jgi:diguanylate cyclase (GGDEF)-like protein|nr:MAG: hypothetical protein CVV44_23185 [Spirochaetae bacterium HGW-Spirochaetae-1]